MHAGLCHLHESKRNTFCLLFLRKTCACVYTEWTYCTSNCTGVCIAIVEIMGHMNQNYKCLAVIEERKNLDVIKFSIVNNDKMSKFFPFLEFIYSFSQCPIQLLFPNTPVNTSNTMNLISTSSINRSNSLTTSTITQTQSLTSSRHDSLTLLFTTTISSSFTSTLIDAWTSIGLSTTTVSATGNIMTSLETSKLLTV